jgi:Na+/H+-dicarboxylate symporter
MLDLIKKYIDNKIQLTKLELISVSAHLASKLIGFFVVALLLMVVVILFNFAAAYGIGQYLNNTALGFTIIGGIYLLFFVIYILFAKDKLGIFVKDYVVKIAIGAQEELNND